VQRIMWASRAVLLAAGLLVSACSPAASPAPTAAPTAAPKPAATTPPAAANPTTPAKPTATTAPAPAPTTAPAPAAAAAAPTGGEVKVGIVSPFSGPVGFLGEYLANSMQIEIDLINASGGLLGKKITLVKRDDTLAPDKSVQFTRELLDNEQVSLLVGPSFTGNYNAAKQLIVDAKVVNCLPTVSGPTALQDAPNTFRAQDPDLLREQDLFTYATQKGIKKIALFTQNDDTGKGYFDRFPDLAQKYNMQLVDSEYWRPDDQDYTPQMVKIKEAGADAVVIATGNSTFAGRAVKAAEGVQFKPQFYGFSGLQGYTYMEQAGDWAVGTQFVSNRLDWFTEKPRAQWPKKYRDHVEAVEKQYGVQTTGNSSQLKGTVLSADCIVTWADAVKKANTFDGPAVAKAWESLSYGVDQIPSGIPVKYSASAHEEFGPGTLFLYQWSKKPTGEYYLEEISGPKTQ
jgi:branched-chain amino acid transport system substrate-binding protein